MSLPKIQQTVFTLTMPSTGKKTRYRQFTVKEEKILLMAQAGGEQGDMISAFKQLITNCCLDELDVDEMPAFDVEYFFIQLRAKSVANKIELTFEEDGVKSEVSINLDEVQVHKPTVSNKMILDEATGVGVQLRYPTFNMVESMAGVEDIESSLKMFANIIELIYDADNVWPAKDASPAELEEFVLSLNNQQVAKIQEFLEDMPYVYIDVKYQVGEEERSQRVRGIESFFG